MTFSNFINLFWDAIEQAFDPFRGKPLTKKVKEELRTASMEAVKLFVVRHNVPGLKQIMMEEANNVLKTIELEKEKRNV